MVLAYNWVGGEATPRIASQKLENDCDRMLIHPIFIRGVGILAFVSIIRVSYEWCTTINIKSIVKFY